MLKLPGPSWLLLHCSWNQIQSPELGFQVLVDLAPDKLKLYLSYHSLYLMFLLHQSTCCSWNLVCSFLPPSLCSCSPFCLGWPYPFLSIWHAATHFSISSSSIHCYKISLFLHVATGPGLWPFSSGFTQPPLFPNRSSLLQSTRSYPDPSVPRTVGSSKAGILSELLYHLCPQPLCTEGTHKASYILPPICCQSPSLCTALPCLWFSTP